MKGIGIFPRRVAQALCVTFVFGLFEVEAAETTIGTGSPAGVYYQVGKAICRLVNAGTEEHGISCKSPSTAGSIFNLENVRKGDLQLSVAQSDWQFHALKGTNRFASAGPDKKLRTVFSVHGEPFTMVARRDSGIFHFEEKNNRICRGASRPCDTRAK